MLVHMNSIEEGYQGCRADDDDGFN